MLNKEIIIFDLDRTLTADRQPLEPEMASLIEELLDVAKVAIISGGTYEQFMKQFVGHLNLSESLFNKLFLLPVSGTSFYQYSGAGEWRCVYKEEIPSDERKKITEALSKIATQAGLGPVPSEHGELIEDRLSQVTLSSLGQDAPLSQKMAWDPDLEKRRKMKKLLDPILPEYEIQIGGATSIDVMMKGVDKAYGIERMSKHLNIPIEKMLFIGDRLEKDGNDASVIKTGVDWIDVDEPEETKPHIRKLIDQANTQGVKN